jgi:outer membrane protein
MTTEAEMWGNKGCTMKMRSCLLSMILICAGPASARQAAEADSLLAEGSLRNCVAYALAHQPTIQQSLLDEQITDRAVNIKLADWFPQVNIGISAQHYYQIPVSVVGGSPVNVSLANASTGTLSVSQTLFSRDVLLASTTAGDVREQSRHRTTGTTIDVVINVSKAFYAALLTRQQIRVLDDDIVRLRESLKDAFAQYQGGVVDKTDYKRATVSLNNALAERKQNDELLKARDAFLKQQMGYPAEGPLELAYDSTQMESEILIDTTKAVRYEDRVEYRLLEVGKRLAEANLSYNDWSFLPTLTAFGDYNMNYQSNQIPPLYTHNFPSSFIGLQLSFPVFLGGKRIQEIKQAGLEVRRAEYDIVAFRNAVNAEYALALAEYKSNLNTYGVLKANLALADEVYRTIQLQYRAGTKTYLEVISAETDLRTAQINRTNALYQVLSSKLDVQKALGTVQY